MSDGTWNRRRAGVQYGLMRFASRLAAVLVLVAVATGCDDTVVVQLRSGPQELDVSSDSLALPDALRDESAGDARIASLACGPMGMCPTTATVPITCEADVCDPAARTITTPVGGVVDFDALASDARSLLRQIDAIEILEATTTAAENTLSIDVPDIELFWGPEGATTVDPAMGVVSLGVLPTIPARSTAPGAAILDPAGVASLSAYLVGTSRRVRFFARTRIDLAPGGAFPEGYVRASVDLTVRITGSIVR